MNLGFDEEQSRKISSNFCDGSSVYEMSRCNDNEDDVGFKHDISWDESFKPRSFLGVSRQQIQISSS